MKNTFASLILVCCFSLAIFSCKQTDTDPSKTPKTETVGEQMRKERMAHNQRVYNEAASNGDDYVALNATYALLADDSANISKYLDTISAIYVRLNLITPAMKVADKILAKDPSNEKMLDLQANAQMSMGNTAEAMNINRKLYEKEKKLKYLFQIASVQLNSRSFKDLETTLSQIESHPDINTDSLEVPSDQQGQIQKVPSKAAAVYLRALIAVDRQNYADAKKKFKQALSIYPRFGMAKKYLDALNNPQMQQQQMQGR